MFLQVLCKRLAFLRDLKTIILFTACSVPNRCGSLEDSRFGAFKCRVCADVALITPFYSLLSAPLPTLLIRHQEFILEQALLAELDSPVVVSLLRLG